MSAVYPWMSGIPPVSVSSKVCTSLSYMSIGIHFDTVYEHSFLINSLCTTIFSTLTLYRQE